MWQRGLLNLIDYEGWIHRDCLVLGSSDVFHYDLRGDSLGALSMWQRGLLILTDFEGWIHRDCYYLYDSDVFLSFSDMNSLFSVEFINP